MRLRESKKMAEGNAPRRLVAGNWKMNGLTASLAEVRALKTALSGRTVGAKVAVCPPATLLAAASAELRGTGILTGGQDCHTEASGAFTGDISAEMLADAGASMVILGHSERRHGLHEADELIARKVKAARRAGLVPILCVGEMEGERDAGKTLDIVGRQLARSLPDGLDPAALVIAYEPVWAIGSGRVPSNDDIEAVHGSIRSELKSRFGGTGAAVAILYGGSVKPANANEILKLKDVGGALVGGASLKAADLLKIIEAA
jgi:triosephosphate isomerase